MQRKEKDVVNGPLNRRNVFEWKMEHFIQRLYARSNTAGIAAQPSFCFPVIARLGAILSTALERPGVEIGVRLGQKGLKPIMFPEVSQERPDLRC